MKNATLWALVSAAVLVLISLLDFIPDIYNSFLFRILNIADVLAKIGLLVFFVTLYNKQNRANEN